VLSGAPGAAAGNFEKPVALDSNRSETQPVSGRPSFKFRLLKNHRAETRREIRGLPRDPSKIPGRETGSLPSNPPKGRHFPQYPNFPGRVAFEPRCVEFRTLQWVGPAPANGRS
jgi:hypothetical protein